MPLRDLRPGRGHRSAKGAAQDLLKRFPDAGTSGFNVVNDPVRRQAACFQPCRPSHH